MGYAGHPLDFRDKTCRVNIEIGNGNIRCQIGKSIYFTILHFTWRMLKSIDLVREYPTLPIGTASIWSPDLTYIIPHFSTL